MALPFAGVWSRQGVAVGQAVVPRHTVETAKLASLGGAIPAAEAAKATVICCLLRRVMVAGTNPALGRPPETAADR